MIISNIISEISEWKNKIKNYEQEIYDLNHSLFLKEEEIENKLREVFKVFSEFLGPNTKYKECGSFGFNSPLPDPFYDSVNNTVYYCAYNCSSYHGPLNILEKQNKIINLKNECPAKWLELEKEEIKGQFIFEIKKYIEYLKNRNCEYICHNCHHSLFKMPLKKLKRDRLARLGIKMGFWQEIKQEKSIFICSQCSTTYKDNYLDVDRISIIKNLEERLLAIILKEI